MKQYYVYIMASASRTLYIGITSDLEGRVYQHQNKLLGGFTAKYNVTRLVHVEAYENPDNALAREKQLKRWVRAKKIWLIEMANPEWSDFREEWVEV